MTSLTNDHEPRAVKVDDIIKRGEYLYHQLGAYCAVLFAPDERIVRLRSALLELPCPYHHDPPPEEGDIDCVRCDALAAVLPAEESS